jgi:hypothetical protein
LPASAASALLIAEEPMTDPAKATDAGVTVIRGPALTYTGDPFAQDLESCRRYESDAAIVMAGGKVVQFGPAARVLPGLAPGTPVTHYPDALIMSTIRRSR